MKLVKMSLAAAVLLGTSAFAIDNLKVSGDAKLLYSTNNAVYTKTGGTETSGLFQQGVAGEGGSIADTALHIGATGDLTKGVSFGVAGYAVSALGLENNLVSNTFSGAHGVAATGDNTSTGVHDAAWVSEVWIASTLGKTTAKIGRMELDTPLAFSEKWSAAANTFEAAVLINQDLPDTTLVGAYVGNGNGVNALGNTYDAFAKSMLGGSTGDYARGAMNANAAGLGIDGIVGNSANFNTFASKGAYAVAAVNNSFKPLTAQAWYYNVMDIADAYWLQADINCQLVKGLKIGAQYADLSPKGGLKSDLAAVDTATANVALVNKDTSAYAVKLAYEGIDKLKLTAAYSSVSKDGALKVANVGTDNLAHAQSKLYTEANWNYGYVGAVGADSYMLLADYDAGIAKVSAQYTAASLKRTGATSVYAHSLSKIDMNEIALTVSKSFGPLDTSLVYVSTAADDQNLKGTDTTGTRYDTIQAYLTLNF